MRQPRKGAIFLLSDARRPVEVTLPTGRPMYREHHLDLVRVVDRSMKMPNGRPNTGSIVDRSMILSTGRPRPERIADRSTPPVDRSTPNDLRSLSTMLTSSYASDASRASRSFCKACSLGNLGLRPSYAKDSKVLLSFLQRIHGGYL